MPASTVVETSTTATASPTTATADTSASTVAEASTSTGSSGGSATGSNGGSGRNPKPFELFLVKLLAISNTCGERGPSKLAPELVVDVSCRFRKNDEQATDADTISFLNENMALCLDWLQQHH